MEYPAEFSAQARNAVEMELIQAWRRDVNAEHGQPNWRMHDAGCIRTCIMSVFLTYAREVIKLGAQKTWAVDKVRKKALEGLCSITIEVTFRAGSFQSWAGWQYLDANVQRDFEQTQEWRQFEDEILAFATTNVHDPGEVASAGDAPRKSKTDVGMRTERARPGPKTDTETAQRVLKIVTPIVGSQPLRSKLDEICDALDEADISRPKTWSKRDPPIWSWADAAATDPELARKAIEHHLENARS